MKKIIAVLLIIVLCCMFVACGKSEATKMVDSLIAEIGEVSLDSGDDIERAENAYAQLTEKDKKKVENLADLMTARSTYDRLLADAKKQAEEADSIIQKAKEVWDEFDAGGALELLESIKAMTVDQEKTVQALQEEIKQNCYEGTHFVKVEYQLEIGKDMVYGNKFRVSHDETVLDDKTTYHLYGFFGNNAMWAIPGLSYLDGKNLKSVSVEKDYPELWSEWAIYESSEHVYPEQANIDDLGNIMAWFYHTLRDEARLELTILRK